MECDIRQTKDNEYVIFHDDNLQRLAKVEERVADVTLKEMQQFLNNKGYDLVTLSDLLCNYKEKAPILLHIKLQDIDLDFIHMLNKSNINFILGVQKPEMAKLCSTELPNNRILAFMPQKEDYARFAQNGAGIIRLWEHWLPSIDINQIKNLESNPEVWIMSCDENGSMNGNIESLNYFEKIGADGVLLNDITLGIRWKNNKQKNHHKNISERKDKK